MYQNTYYCLPSLDSALPSPCPAFSQLSVNSTPLVWLFLSDGCMPGAAPQGRAAITVWTWIGCAYPKQCFFCLKAILWVHRRRMLSDNSAEFGKALGALKMTERPQGSCLIDVWRRYPSIHKQSCDLNMACWKGSQQRNTWWWITSRS